MFPSFAYCELCSCEWVDVSLVWTPLFNYFASILGKNRAVSCGNSVFMLCHPVFWRVSAMLISISHLWKVLAFSLPSISFLIIDILVVIGSISLVLIGIFLITPYAHVLLSYVCVSSRSKCLCTHPSLFLRWFALCLLSRKVL